MLWVPFCPIFSQRQAVAKKHGIPSNLIEDVLLTCCCGFCALIQNANQMGSAAEITNFKIDMLTKPPTSQDMNHAVSDTTNNLGNSKTDNPLHK